MKFKFKNYEIEIKDDNYYSGKSDNNLTNYKYEYTAGKALTTRSFAMNKRGIIIKDLDNGTELSNVLLCENGGRAEINENKCKIEGEELWVCVGDYIYCLDIPSLKLNWFKRTDIGTNYSIHNFQDDSIIYGEFGVLRINKQGVIQWQFMGGDGIFKEGEGRFLVEGDVIILVDENDEKYVVNEGGTKI